MPAPNERALSRSFKPFSPSPFRLIANAPHAHHTSRETLRVDLAQTGAAPIRPSNGATLWITRQGLRRPRFQCRGNTLDSTRLLSSTVEKCLVLATGQKNYPTGLAMQNPKESSALPPIAPPIARMMRLAPISDTLPSQELLRSDVPTAAHSANSVRPSAADDDRPPMRDDRTPCDHGTTGPDAAGPIHTASADDCIRCRCELHDHEQSGQCNQQISHGN
jgi:hypothetical protein